MEFENQGNLGRVDLLNRHITQKYFSDDTHISKEELEEISHQLKQFNYLLANLYLHENSLRNDGQRTIVSIMEELETFYRNYKKEEAKKLEFVF